MVRALVEAMEVILVRSPSDARNRTPYQSSSNKKEIYWLT